MDREAPPLAASHYLSPTCAVLLPRRALLYQRNANANDNDNERLLCRVLFQRRHNTRRSKTTSRQRSKTALNDNTRSTLEQASAELSKAIIDDAVTEDTENEHCSLAVSVRQCRCRLSSGGLVEVQMGERTLATRSLPWIRRQQQQHDGCRLVIESDDEQVAFTLCSSGGELEETFRVRSMHAADAATTTTVRFDFAVDAPSPQSVDSSGGGQAEWVAVVDQLQVQQQADGGTGESRLRKGALFAVPLLAAALPQLIDTAIES